MVFQNTPSFFSGRLSPLFCKLNNHSAVKDCQEVSKKVGNFLIRWVVFINLPIMF